MFTAESTQPSDNQNLSPTQTKQELEDRLSTESGTDEYESTRPRRRFIYNAQTAYSQFSNANRYHRRPRTSSTSTFIEPPLSNESDRVSEPSMSIQQREERNSASSYSFAVKELSDSTETQSSQFNEKDDFMISATPTKDYFRHKKQVQSDLKKVVRQTSSIALLESEEDKLPILIVKTDDEIVDQDCIVPNEVKEESTIEVSSDEESENRNSFSNVNIEGSYGSNLRRIDSGRLQFDATDPNLVTFLGGFRKNSSREDGDHRLGRTLLRSKKLDSQMRLIQNHSNEQSVIRERLVRACGRVPEDIISLDPLSWKTRRKDFSVRFKTEPEIRVFESEEKAGNDVFDSI
uniref:AlNc14C58G4345 protein n=1 Tax=Albugo laibachii Nc14 TaxID=890382 RepID=F0WCG5_9STRA|nr:AlNc14C58G4345 [Albugo laibachii Nc14]|eukprot:CCA18880.1 AlNc14C58G4345 [Albugo laibachii Nc14]